MTVLMAATVGILFGCGTLLLLKPDLLRVVVGTVLIANAGTLTLLASGRERGDSPILPLADRPSDPLVQAMAVTALVIGFAVTALLLSIAHRVYTSYGTGDLDRLAEVEAGHEHDIEREEVSV